MLGVFRKGQMQSDSENVSVCMAGDGQWLWAQVWSLWAAPGQQRARQWRTAQVG